MCNKVVDIYKATDILSLITNRNTKSINGKLTLTVTATTTCSDALCTGSATATLSGGQSPCTYLWNDINHQTTQTATNLCVASYRVTVTDANGCTKVKTGIAVPSCTKSMNDDNEAIDGINVFPNPVSSQLSILIDNQDKSDESTVISIEMYNLLGELISVEKKQISYGVPFLKDVTYYPPGLYMITITDGEDHFTQRVIIQK